VPQKALTQRQHTRSSRWYSRAPAWCCSDSMHELLPVQGDSCRSTTPTLDGSARRRPTGRGHGAKNRFLR
jgi:hypothetical protein